MPGLGLGRNLSVPRRMGGVTAGAQYFNGTTTRVQLTNAMTLQDFTIMCWVKLDYTAANLRIIDFRDGPSDGVGLLIPSSPTAVRCQYHGASSTYASFVNDTWIHLAYTANTTGDLLTPIINGVAQSTASIAGTDIATTTAGRIGARAFSTATEFFKGRLAQMAIFDTALSAAQVTAIMNKTYSQLTAGEKTGLVSWWALTNISGTSVPDLHGTNTGTLTP